MDMNPLTTMPRGFLLPVLLLLLSLCGVLALSMVASATLDTRASQAAWFRRVAFEAAEDTLAYAIREAPARTAPWEANWTTSHGVKVWLQVRPLGQWATAAEANGTPTVERHERAVAQARAGRGAAVQLEQDFAYLPPSSTSTASVAQRTVWRSVEVTP
jgi:hypothetical protein